MSLGIQPLYREKMSLGSLTTKLKNTAAGFSVKWPATVDQFEPVSPELFDVLTRVGVTHFSYVKEHLTNRYAANLTHERETRMDQFKGCPIGVDDVGEPRRRI